MVEEGDWVITSTQISGFIGFGNRGYNCVFQNGGNNAVVDWKFEKVSEVLKSYGLRFLRWCMVRSSGPSCKRIAAVFIISCQTTSREKRDTEFSSGHSLWSICCICCGSSSDYGSIIPCSFHLPRVDGTYAVCCGSSSDYNKQTKKIYFRIQKIITDLDMHIWEQL